MKLIVAVDQNWGIGQEGGLLVYLPEDLRRFKRLTLGHSVILGRKTLATFPGGRPLPGRRNLILTRTPNFSAEDAELFSDLDSLCAAAPEDAFVIGGASVYLALLDKCDTAYITKIDASYPADAFFPNLDAHSDWQAGEETFPEEPGIPSYRYITYHRRISTCI